MMSEWRTTRTVGAPLPDRVEFEVTGKTRRGLRHDAERILASYDAEGDYEYRMEVEPKVMSYESDLPVVWRARVYAQRRAEPDG